MRKLEIRIEELEAALQHSNKIYSNQLFDIVDNRATMRFAYAAILDALQELHTIMRDDPAFMYEFGKKQVEANF